MAGKYYSCERCDEEDGLMGVNYTDLMGLYPTRLCVRCRRAWHVAVHNMPERRAYRLLEFREHQLIALTQHDGIDRSEEFTRLYDEHHALTREFYRWAGEFVANRWPEEVS